jgi:hypothetical protein
VDSARALRRRRDSDPLANFRRYLEEIEVAVLNRDAMLITSLLRKRTATHLPREVREELLALSRMSRESLRAPVQFLRFQHRMAELAAGGERLLTAQTELRLDPPAFEGAIRRPTLDDRAAASQPKPGPSDDSGEDVET